MGRPKKIFPAYPGKAHASGRAVIRLNGKDIYLAGAFNSPESHEDYHAKQAAAYYSARMAVPAPPVENVAGLTVRQVALRHLEAMQAEQLPKQLHRTKVAMQLLSRCCGALPASAFGVAELESVGKEALREQPCSFCRGKAKRGDKPCRSCSSTGRQTWSRQYVNKLLARIKAAWDWAVKWRIVPTSPLRSFPGIRKGFPGSRESPAVRSVPRKIVRQTQKQCQPILRDMIEVQLLCGARPEDVCRLRRGDIDTAGVLPEVGKFPGVWVARLARHKNDWRGHDRILFFGPKAQKVLRRYLARPPDRCIFVPAEAAVAAMQSLGRRPLLRQHRPPGQEYHVSSYWHAVQRAAKRAGVPGWGSNQLRHLRASEIRSRYGPDAARIVLGHSIGGVTAVYAEADLSVAAKVAREIG